MILEPLDIRLEAAACAYYNVSKKFFRLKRKDGNTDKRRLLFWLLFTDVKMGKRNLARKYGYSNSAMGAAISSIEFSISKEVYLRRDMECIRKMAEDGGTEHGVLSEQLTNEELTEQIEKLREGGKTYRQIQIKLRISLSKTWRLLNKK